MRAAISKILVFLLFPSLIRAQAADPAIGSDSSGNWHAGIELQAVATSNNTVPFWMRTNQFGSIPLSGVSGSLLAYTGRDYIREEEEDSPRLTDWGFSLSGRLNAGNTAQFLLTEAYVKGRLSIFQLKAGRSKDITGLTGDSSLSSGAFAVSGNAQGIPKIELSIPEYWYLPLTGKLVALKGSFAHGWFGETPLRYTQKDSSVHSWYHQTSLYGRIGKPGWRLKLYGGINHQVMWGHERSIEPEFDLSTLESFWYVVRGVKYGSQDVPTSKVGNHLGSLDQGMQYDFNAFNIMVYHQFFYDIGGLYHGSNLKDGLWGLVFRNKKAGDNASFGWRKILLEYLGSQSQGGENYAPVTPSGSENYYNNYIYAQGWTYDGENTGNNFLTQRKYARPGQAMRDKEIIINNRVKLLHIGIEGFLGKWSWQTRLSFSNNFGTYATNAGGGPSTGGVWVIYPPPYFERVKQFSGYIAADRPLNKNYRIGFVLAADRGKLLNNSTGGMISISRVW